MVGAQRSVVACGVADHHRMKRDACLAWERIKTYTFCQFGWYFCEVKMSAYATSAFTDVSYTERMMESFTKCRQSGI